MLRAAVVSGVIIAAAVAGGIVMRGTPGAPRVAPSGLAVPSELAAPHSVAPGVLRPPHVRPRTSRSLLIPRGAQRTLPGRRHTPCFREGSLPCVPVCTYRVHAAAPGAALGRNGCPSLAPQGCLHPAASLAPAPTCGLRPLPRVVIRRP